ncbi:MAG: class I SAM-dependent methyltransferase [Micromonosporaceae bacterium]
MPQPLDAALGEVRALLLDSDRLVRAVAAGRQRAGEPLWQRAEIRPVALKSGTMLQISLYDGQRPHTRNITLDTAASRIDELLAQPYGAWHVQTTEETVQLRVTKRGQAQLHRQATPASRNLDHDRAKQYLLDPGDPLFNVVGASAAKRRQVEAFLRQLDAALPTAELEQLDTPLRVADLGCGNAYLTFAAYRYLTAARGVQLELTGIERRPDQRARNARLAEQLGCSEQVRFVEGSIIDAPTPAEGPPQVVLALHACDTATDEALARAVRWKADRILAAPCCHHEISAQLRTAPSTPYPPMTRHGILRERFADVLTDSLRAALLRLAGYRVEVAEFVASQHTPRNVMLRAERTDAAPTQQQRDEYRELVDAWGVQPALDRLLAGVGATS